MSTVSFDELETLVGQDLGVSEWREVTQETIDKFAEATGDHQWIHVDPERAQESDLGVTIAHGYLTVSLLPVLVRDLLQVEGLRMAINYGLNRCRFPSPVPSGARVRAAATVTEVSTEKDGSKRVLLDVTVEIDGRAKPACVAQTVSRYYPVDE